jgi:nucleoside-diphosphate-sugar epimerase
VRVLVTGASGFIGRNLLLAADPEWEIVATWRSATDFPAWADRSLPGRRITTVQCDLSDPSAVEQVLGETAQEFDLVYHLAARVDIPGSLRDPAADLADNALATLNLVSRVRSDHLVQLSTGAVYEGQSGQVDRTRALEPSLPYAAHKLLAEHYAIAARERWTTARRVTVVRFFGAYGPYEPAHKIHTRLVRALALERRRDFEIYGDGSNLIDAMWVADAITGLLTIGTTGLARPPGVETVDFAAGDPISIETLVRRAAGALNAGDVELTRRGTAHESNAFHADPRPLEEAYGVRAVTHLEDGLRALAEFLRGRHPAAGTRARP